MRAPAIANFNLNFFRVRNNFFASIEVGKHSNKKNQEQVMDMMHCYHLPPPDRERQAW